MNDIEFIETTSWTNSGRITKQIPVINNRIISIDSGGGGLIQLVSRPVYCYLTGNPQVSFFEHGSKYLWNNLFYHSNSPFNIRSDDYSISTITDLTGRIQYNPADVSEVYSPYYDQYHNEPNTSNTPTLETPETPETLCTQIDKPKQYVPRRRKYPPKSKPTNQLITCDNLYSSVINDAIKNGKYQMVFTIYADLARERRRHAVIAMNIHYFD